MRGGVVQGLTINLLIVLLLFLCLHESCCSPLDYFKSSVIKDTRTDALSPQISPSAAPQPLYPLLAPLPLTPFTNNTVPKLSGMCMLNFAAVESMLSMTSIDCAATFAPFLANVICCPQLEATLVVLIGQSSKDTNMLALNGTLAKHCLSDFDQLLVGQGASDILQQICSIRPSNLTAASCPVKDVNEFESTVDGSMLLEACEKIDVVNECCNQICQNAISEAARKLALKAYDLLSIDGSPALSDHSARVDDCKIIVHRWLASKLDPLRAKDVLRGVSNCNVNKVCPLVFPSISHVAKGCGNGIRNQAACCNAMESYVSHLQKQSFITNLQALNCAASLGMKLQKANITENVYYLCRISLKDFSLQAPVGIQESGCLLPSLPSDATFDKSAGVTVVCDLNDNIPAPWPSTFQVPASSCNKTVKLPALPAAASGQSGLFNADIMFHLLFAASMVFMIIL
ncbi:putative GPI-anchored protein [Camellia lanceoleosa]|uniref:GPI-anchored protein n=1 Tax=Camellia lanceoleosa TaxID=1840588 RepID=A0ACC0GML5_9ERIC|nr:putative GPI-anchored protein [Camellia lanceoleosa]